MPQLQLQFDTMSEVESMNEQNADVDANHASTPKKRASKSKGSSRSVKKSVKKKVRKPEQSSATKRTRTARSYPVVSFKEATQIGDAIFKFASGEKVRRLTLLEKMERNPNSSTTRMLITNSGKYGITVGSYSAEFLEFTELGRIACDPGVSERNRLEAQCELAIIQIAPFNLLYETYKGKKLPVHEVMKDVLSDSSAEVEDVKECIDLFVVNIKDLGLLRTIAGAETLIPIEQALDELGNSGDSPQFSNSQKTGEIHGKKSPAANSTWSTTCFYVTAIGEEGSDARKHSDLFLSMLVEPALKELKLDVVRADRIAEPGMITTQIIEHIKHSKLVVVDLSLLNPNVFYEMALRHAVRLPIVQIIQKVDKLPFDVNQVNSIVIDNTDIYTFTPKIETYRSQITTFARRAIEDPEHFGNPISVFYPEFWK